MINSSRSTDVGMAGEDIGEGLYDNTMSEVISKKALRIILRQDIAQPKPLQEAGYLTGLFSKIHNV
jgi:hypothetical protein